MAPPPNTNAPLTQRVVALAQTLQFAWFAGHVTLLLTAFRYSLSYITFNSQSRWAKFSYRTAFLAAALTYGIVVAKAYRARVKLNRQTGVLQLLQDENVQYLIMALFWLFLRQIPLAILPFAVYSVFHVLTYTRQHLLPTLFPQAAAPGATPTSPTQKAPKPSGGLSDSIGRFVREYYDASMTLVAGLEILLWFRLVISALLFQRGSWILFVVYSIFLRTRYALSSFVQGAFAQLGARIDARVAAQGTPDAARNGWNTVKSVLAVAVEKTDLSKYVAGPQGPPKKAQ